MSLMKFVGLQRTFLYFLTSFRRIESTELPRWKAKRFSTWRYLQYTLKFATYRKQKTAHRSSFYQVMIWCSQLQSGVKGKRSFRDTRNLAFCFLKKNCLLIYDTTNRFYSKLILQNIDFDIKLKMSNWYAVNDSVRIESNERTYSMI